MGSESPIYPFVTNLLSSTMIEPLLFNLSVRMGTVLSNLAEPLTLDRSHPIKTLCDTFFPPNRFQLFLSPLPGVVFNVTAYMDFHPGI